MLASPAHISRLTTILVVSAAFGLADIEPWDCDKDDATCSLHDAIPSAGETLLQRIAWSSHSSPSSPHKKKAPLSSPHKKKAPSGSPLSQKAHQEDAAASPESLPPGAKEFFEEKLCKGHSASEGKTKKKKSLVTKTAATRLATPNFIESQNDEPQEMRNAKTAKGEVSFDGDDHEALEGKPNASQEQVTKEEASREEDEFRSSRMSYDASSHGQHPDPAHSSANNHLPDHEEDDIIKNAFLTEGDAFVERSSALLKLHSKTPGPESLFPWILLQRPSDTKSHPKAVKRSREVVVFDDDSGFGLDRVGFEKVRSLHSIPKMKSFVTRMAAACDMKVIDEGGLTGAATFLIDFKGDVSLDNIKEALFKALMAASKDHWATVNVKDDVTGSSAPLDVIGFVQVRALRNAEETITFVTRMIDHLGIEITDQAGFDDLMQSYSEPDDSLSFQSLLTKIKKAAKQRTWAELK